MATIQGVYVALFGRPADPVGLTYFNGVTKNGADLSGIGDLASTQEYKDRFAGQNNTQIVNSIYQSLFGRDAEAAGLTFFVNALNNGTLNIKNIAIAILDGAQGTDKTISGNKVAAADLYTKSLDTAQEIGSYQGNAAAAQGRAFLAGVSSSVPAQSAVDAAILSMQAAGAAGATITLQTNADELSLTKGVTDGFGVTKFTTNNNDTVVAGNNFAATLKIDGGLGIDTITGNIGGAVVTNTDTLTNVEVVKLTATAASTLNLDNTSGVTDLISVGNGGGFGIVASNVALSTKVGVTGDLTGAANSFAFKDADLNSTANLSLDTAKGAGTVTIATVGTVAVSNTGASDVALVTADAKTVSISGDGTLKVAITDANLQTLNASAFTGNLTYDATANAAIKTITSGSGNDALTIDTAHTNDVKIDAGAGNDTITVTAVGAATKALALTGGAGADQFVFTAASANVVAIDTAANLVKTLVTISDFDKSADAIKITVGGASPRDLLLGAEQTDISAQANLLDAVTKAASYTDASKISVFSYGSDTYLFVNDAAAGLNAGDTLIKVTGIAAADLTATNFQVS